MDLVTLVSEPTTLGPSVGSVLGDSVDANYAMLRHSASLDVGTTVRLSTLISVNGQLSDPASLLLRVKDPAGAESFPSLVQDSTGVFYGDLQVLSSGQWRYRFETDTAVREGSFIVRKSAYGTRGTAPVPDTSSAWGVGSWGGFPWPGDTSTSAWGNFPWGQDTWR